jgi:hypothetical protein
MSSNYHMGLASLSVTHGHYLYSLYNELLHRHYLLPISSRGTTVLVRL